MQEKPGDVTLHAYSDSEIYGPAVWSRRTNLTIVRNNLSRQKEQGNLLMGQTGVEESRMDEFALEKLRIE